MKKRALLRHSMAITGAFTIALALCSPVLAEESVQTAPQTLEITAVSYENGLTTTGRASTVNSVSYTVDGGEEITETADSGKVLTLVVDGAQEELEEGAVYTVDSSFQVVETTVYKTGGPSAPPWQPDSDKSTYYFRQALLIDDGTLLEDGSVTAAVVGGSYDSSSTTGITVTSNGSHFNGLYVTGNSKYTVSDSEFYAYGDGGDDFSGWGAAVMADENTDLTIDNTYIETAGTIRTAVWVGGNSKTTVNNSLIYSQETQDDYDTYSALVPAMMKRVPFALGMEGTIRATNVLNAGQAVYNNSMIISTGWGALSTDSGTAYSQTGTYALEVNDSIAGIGTVEEANAAKNYDAVFELNGKTYGFTMGGSGYVTYADSGVHNKYTNVKFYSPDYVQIMASGEASSEYEGSYMYSDRIAFMTQQAGGGTLTLKDSEVDTTDALMQIKSGKANKGYSNLVVDNTDVDFSGDSVRTEDGILVELVESDDAGNPGVTEYTVNDTGDEAVPTSSEIDDSTAIFKNGSYTGDIWNSIYNNRQALDVSLENADLTGTVSSSVAVHVDPENGEVVENGTLLKAYTGSEEYDHANYLAADGGTTGDYLTIGSFSHTASETVNNPINLSLDEDSAWKVTGDCYLNNLNVADLADISADEAVTVYAAELTVDGQAYEDGTYTSGNVTLVVEESDTAVEDTGIVASGQTYANIPYTFYAVEEDGTKNSKAVTLTTQNWTDGNVYFNLFAADGYEITDTTVSGGTISEIPADADAEVASYGYVLVPDGTGEMTVTITVRSLGDGEDPSDKPEDPSDKPEDPSDTTEDPSDTTEDPSDTTGDPSDTTGDPSDTTQDPSDTAGGQTGTAGQDQNGTNGGGNGNSATASTTAKSAKTSDSNQAAAWLIVFGAAVCASVVVARKRKA